MPTGRLPHNHDENTRILASLAKVHHFAALPQETLQGLADIAAPYRFTAGQVIYLEGEPAERIYILESGWVKAVRMSPDGREQAMLFLRPGEIFGDIAAFTGVPYPGTVVALEDGSAVTLPTERLLALVNAHPALAMAVIRRLGERVLYFIRLVEDLSLRSVQARLARTLLENAEPSGEGSVVQRRSWTTFDEMATRLGTVRDVLGRALRALEEEGLLKVERQAITILDEEGLKARAET